MERVDYESIVIQDILNLKKNGELDISPWYQRRSVWRKAQKAYLVNTLHERMPVPSVYIRHSIDLEHERSVKEVVDGQQRIRCVLDFREGKFAARHPNHERPVLYDELSPTERSRFLLTPLSVGYLVGATDEDVIEIFARINSASKTLNPQEKRNAKYSGAFKQFALTEAVKRLAFWRGYKVFTDNNIARMDEVQFVSDLVMNLDKGLQDWNAAKLNRFYEEHEEDYPSASTISARLDDAFSRILDVKPDVFRGSVFCRPQVLFTLVLVLDKHPRRELPGAVLSRLVEEVDTRVLAVKSGDSPGALDADTYEAFAGGNQHRIGSRTRRMNYLEKYIGA